MATKTVRVSDLSGSEESVESISFALAGQAFTLDITAKEREVFLKSFEHHPAGEQGEDREVRSDPGAAHAGVGEGEQHRSPPPRCRAQGGAGAVSSSDR